MRLPGPKDRLSLRNDQNVAGNSALPSSPNLSNADIADRLASLAQLLSTQKENPFKVKAYRRAAAKVRTLSESVDELVRDGSDLTEFAGIGAAIKALTRVIRSYRRDVADLDNGKTAGSNDSPPTKTS